MNNRCQAAAGSTRRRPALWLLASAALLLAAGAGAWCYWRHGCLPPRRWGVIDPGWSYRSSQLSPRQLTRILPRQRIARVVDLCWPDPDNALQQAEKQLAAELGVEYRNYPLYGSGIGTVWHYAYPVALLAAARRENKPVLVHCAAGVQRTGGVVAAYRLLVQRRPPDDVRAELIRYGWQPERDALLAEFLNSRMAELAARLLEMGVIDALPDPLPKL